MKREDIHIRDPFILYDGGHYYLLGTTGDDPWGRASTLELYRSDDLSEFERQCVLVTDGSLDDYTNIWAPELHVYRGRYYLIVSAYREDLGRGSFIYVSERLDEPFRMLTGRYITPAGWGCLDATLFVWEGAPYLCFSNEWTTPVTGDGDGSLYIARLTDDLTALIGTPKKIVSGRDCPVSVEVVEEPYRGYVAEGPYLYGEGDHIALLWSTFTSTGYSVLKSVSYNGVSGDYELQKTLFDKDGGHCMRFVDASGRAWIALHQPNVTPNERMRLFAEDTL